MFALSQGSEAVEDCVQGALSSLYPPFESTAPPLLSQSQYLGCLFLHSGWPLCLGEKVVVQLSTLDWRLLRSNDFYLQVVPFSTRCPRLALKCLALGGRNVQEVLVPESQHPLVFTAEWLHCINKERGCKREGGGGLDTCLVSTSDGVVRIPWDEVVYPKLLHNPTDLEIPSTNTTALDYLSSNTGSLGWCPSSADPDTWSWDEEDDLPPDGDEADIDPTLRRLRQASDGCGDYVDLLEPRGGPDGGTDSKQRYLEMHGICKTKTLPLCRRSKAIRIRRGRAWGYAKTEISGRTGSLRRRDSNSSRKNSGGARKDLVNSRPPPRVIDLVRERQPSPQCIQDIDGDDGDALDNRDLYLEGPSKERRPGVGEERKGAGTTLPWEERHRGRASCSELSSRSKYVTEIDTHGAGNVGADQSDQDQGFHSDCVFEDDKSLTEGTDNIAGERQVGKLEERVCPKGKDVKVGGFRAPRYNITRGKGRELADVMERRKVDILCVQETRWKGSKARSIGAGFKLFYYGVDSKRNGVGVVLKEEFVRNVLEVGCELEEKERFWSELDEVMESIPTGERVVIGADFNGHVGEGNTGDEEVMGKFGVKERNLEGQMVVDFAKRMDMGVVNTYFQKREEHRVTYKSGGRSTQKKRSEIEKKTKWWKLKKEECCEEFRQKLRQALGGQVVLPDDWETTAEVIRETGRKVLGVSSGRRKEDKETWWWNEEVQDSIQRKRLAKKKWDMDRTEENRQEYKELQRRVKREVSKAKQKAYDELYTRLDTREGEKDLYRVLTSEESVQRRWKEYFEDLMNEENEREKRVEGVNSVEQKVDKIRKDEVRKALKRMKSGKAVGPDDIPVEVWKCLGEAAVEFLASLFNRVLENLEKAYDRVPREELWYCMRKSGIAEKYVRVVQDMYERSRTVVRCAVVMDQLSEEVRQESPWTMMFADDIVICSESREQVEENLERWRFALERRGMKVSRIQSNGECGKEGKVYRTVVRPAMLYGLETVSLRKRQESELEVAELKMLRRRRKAKGGKGKGKSGGRGNPKNKEDPSSMKGQKKETALAETSNSPAKSALCKDSHSDEGKNTLKLVNGHEADPQSADGARDKQPKSQSEIFPDGETQSDKVSTDHSPEATVPSAPSNQSKAPSPKAYLLRNLNEDLLQSGKFIITGTVDRLGRGLVITETHIPEDSHHLNDIVQLLSCYYSITRSAAREKGLTVLVDSRQASPSELCFSALRSFKAQVPAGLGCVLILTEEEQESGPYNLDGIEVHTVKGTGVLQQYVDRQQLTKEMDGDFEHSHNDWLTFRLSLEQLTERCESVLSLLEVALKTMGAEPLPDCIKSVPLSVEKHKQVMTSVLSDQRLTELQRRGGAWLAGLANGTSRLAHRSPDCRAALAATSSLYDSVDDSLHRLVRVSNQRSHDLEALSRLSNLVDKLDKCETEIDRVQEQLEEYKDPPLSLSRLSLKQQKFRSFRESAMELHSETLVVLGEVEGWSELEWGGLTAVLKRLPLIREKVRGMSHCLSDCWTQLDNTQRLLSTLTEASQWCDVVSSSSPNSPPSSPLSSLPPIPPSRFQDARALALELGGGALLDLWAQTLERYQRTLAQFKTRMLQAERGMPITQGQDPSVAVAQAPKTPVSSASSLWEIEGEGDGEWCGGGGEGGLQSWGSLASLFRPQNCSTLKIGEEKKKEGAAGAAGGGKFLQNLLNPSKKSPTEAPLPPKPPRRRHPSFDLQALLAPRRSAAAAPKTAEAPLAVSSRSSPLSWLGRKAVAEPILMAGIATAVPGWRDEKVGGGVGGSGVLIRGVEVSSKEVADHTGLTRQHVLLGRTDREAGVERPGTTAQSKLYLQWCRLVNSERQYVALLKAVEETYFPLLDSSDTPVCLRGKADSIFSNWSSIATFHSQLLLPAIEDALSQTLQQTDCFSKYRDQLLQYAHYIRMKPEPDSPLVNQAADFFKAKLSSSPVPATISFPQCLAAPTQRLQHYCEILEELGGVYPSPDSALSIIRHTQRHGEDLRISDLITGCPVPVGERGELVRQGELYVCPGGRRKKTGIRTVFLYQHYIILTKHKTPSQGCSAYTYKNSIKTGEMGLTQCVGEDGLRFEVWVRQTSRTKYCLTLQASSSEDREAWTHDIAQLLWTHAIHNTELCLKESLCMGLSSKLLLDVTGAQTSELDSSFSLNDRENL
ncbi:hypothetical protein QTP86_033619 [Hemibagrus guttatus]|nr:hypothetical protein QTP86_033619 [Hemibagrus guttatus]